PPGLDEEAGVVLIAGHRRLAAARLAKLATVPTIFRPDLDSEAKQVIAMLIENGQRADLNAIEEARSSLDPARFVVAAMWEFLAEAYDWGPDELAEFADLIGVQVAPAAHL